MGPISALVTYIIIWWVMIFCVLPFGLERDADGMPKNPRLKKKLLITSILSLILLGIVYALVEYSVIDFREIARGWAEKDYG